VVVSSNVTISESEHGNAEIDRGGRGSDSFSFGDALEGRSFSASSFLPRSRLGVELVELDVFEAEKEEGGNFGESYVGYSSSWDSEIAGEGEQGFSSVWWSSATGIEEITEADAVFAVVEPMEVVCRGKGNDFGEPYGGVRGDRSPANERAVRL